MEVNIARIIVLPFRLGLGLMLGDCGSGYCSNGMGQKSIMEAHEGWECGLSLLGGFIEEERVASFRRRGGCITIGVINCILAHISWSVHPLI